MKFQPEPKDVQQLETELKAAFAPYKTQEFADLASEALAGEYFGFATYAAFEQETAGEAERRFWALARDVERVTIRGLEQLLDRHGITRPEREKFFELGQRTAVVFAGEPHQGYCDWVAPLIDKALAGFRKLEALGNTRADRAILAEVVAHEKAFASAWGLLPNGYAAAASPFAAHLKTVGASEKYL